MVAEMEDSPGEAGEVNEAIVVETGHNQYNPIREAEMRTIIMLEVDEGRIRIFQTRRPRVMKSQ